MTVHPFVSVIVLNWNGKGCIRSCLKSLLDQTYPNYKVIVVDNASTDGSPEIVKKEFPKVKLIINDRNLGFAKGNNVGIKVAKGDLVALFNYDAVADSNWLLELVSAIMKSRNNGIVGGPIYYFESDDVIWAAGGKMDALTGFDWHPYQGEKLGTGYTQLTEDIDFVPGCALLIKRKAIDKIGLLDEHYFLYYDDLDWGLTVKKAGYACKFVPSALVYHKVSFSWRGKGLVGYYNFVRSKFHLYLKHFPVPFLVTTMFFQTIFTFFEIFFFKRPITYAQKKVQAFGWNIRNWRKIVEERVTTKKIGKYQPKIRLVELLHNVENRIRTKQYYW